MEVLLVEDNRGDAELLMEAFEEVQAGASWVVVDTPHGCLHQLRIRRWDLILVDLRLGPHDGHVLLDQIHQTSASRDAPLYVLSSSSAPRDIERAKRHHEFNGYLQKPFSIEGWFALARSLAGDHSSRSIGGILQ